MRLGGGCKHMYSVHTYVSTEKKKDNGHRGPAQVCKQHEAKSFFCKLIGVRGNTRGGEWPSEALSEAFQRCAIDENICT